MYILPYILKPPCSTEIPLTQLLLFMTNGGKDIWKTDEEKASFDTLDTLYSEYLEPNGFFGKVTIKGDCAFVEVDQKRIRLDDYYFWTDDNVEDKECWRPFFYLGSSGESWGWDELVREVRFGAFGSLERIWKGLSIME